MSPGGTTAAAGCARACDITVEQWRKLPWLLPRSVVLEITGLNWRELQRAVETGQLRQFKQSPTAKAKYYKSDLAGYLRIDVGPSPPQSAPIHTN